MPRIAIIILLLFSFIKLRAQDVLEQIANNEKQAYARQQEASRASRSVNNYNIIYDRLNLQVNPNVDYIAGSVTTYFIPDEDMTSIQFDLSDTMLVDSILYHGTPLSVTRPGGDLIIANFPEQLPATVVDSLTIYYEGEPVATDFGSFEQTLHDSVPVIWTLSEPYGAKDWWPCKQDLKDKIDSLDVLVTTPDSFRVPSNGLLVEQIHNDSSITYHWKHRYPIATYLVCFAVTNYAVYYDTVTFNGDTLPVFNYVYPEDLNTARQQTALIVPVMQLYDSLFGEYPFSHEKYGHAEFSWPCGMEHQTMTFVCNFGFDLLAHELGHHWFGDKVTLASWQDVWLNEGFATYLNGLSREHIEPSQWMNFKQNELSLVLGAPTGSVYCTDTSNANTIFNNRTSYAKGSCVLHMLRWELGDSLFFASLRNYLDDIHNAYAFANTADLQSHFESTTGQSFEQFFSEWVYGEGFPSYQLSYSQNFSREVNVTLQQTQSAPSSVSFFHVPVPALFSGSGMDTIIVFNPPSSGQQYSFRLPFLVDSVVIDPDVWIISGNNTVIRQAAYNFSILTYPNPVADVLQIRVESALEHNATLKIVNELGQVMWTGTAILQSGSDLLQIDVQKLEAGIYRATIEIPGQTQVASFIKAR